VARIGVTVLLYATAVAWLTWPLVLRMATHLSAADDSTRFDALYAAWALAWETHTLTTAPTALPDANIYHPTGRALFYGPTAFGALPFFAPLFLASGNPTLALNATYLVSIVLTAAALHLVVWRWTGAHLAGVVGAWTFLTSRWVFWEWLPTAPHAAVLCYLPLIVLRASVPAARLADTAPLLVLIVAQCLTDLSYVAPAVLFPLALLAVLRVLRRATRGAGLRLLAVVGMALVALAPAIAGHLEVVQDNPLLRQQTIWRIGEGPRALPWGPIATFTPLSVAPVVFAVIALGAVAAWVGRRSDTTRRAWRHAASWSAVGLVISLTPVVLWNDQPVHLPHDWLQAWLPIYRFVRAPSRLGIVALIGVALLAGLAFAALADRLGSRRRALAPLLAAGAVAVTYAQYARGFSWPFPRAALSDAYPLQAAISSDPLVEHLRASDGAVLELPINRPGSRKPYQQAAAMYRSIFHWRPLVNGYSSYFPATFPGRMHAATQLPDPWALAALRAETGMTSIVVHGALLTPAERARWMKTVAGLTLVAQLGEDLLFAVSGP
jgi:hypothetical protein